MKQDGKAADPSQVTAARRFVCAKLKGYGFSLDDIGSMLGVSLSTLRRWTSGTHLRRRSPQEGSAGEPDDAYVIALVVLIRADYPVPVIMEVLGISQATVYRARDDVRRQYDMPRRRIREIRMYLRNLVSERRRPRIVRELEAEQRRKRWIKKNRYNSN